MPRRAESARALILAGPLKARPGPLTETIPGCLTPIAGRPLLDYWVDALAEAGVAEAMLDARAGQVREYIEAVNASGRLRLTEAHEPDSSRSMAAAADLADGVDHVLIIDAINLGDADLRALLRYHRRHGDPLTMMLSPAVRSPARRFVELDADGRVVSFATEPQRPSGGLADAGLYAVEAAAYREITALRGHDAGTDLLGRFAGRMRGWVWGGYHREIDTPAALEQAERDLGAAFSGPGGVRTSGRRPAVFLDRDGTVIEHVHYLTDPALVRLLPGAAAALRRLRRAGFARVLATNQSAIGRGMLTDERLAEIHGVLERQLAAEGATFDSIYYCPDAPKIDGDGQGSGGQGNGNGRAPAGLSDRKPGPGMLLKAAAELDLDLAGSWMVGDLMSDVLAGLNAGCRSILIGRGDGDADAVDPNGRYLIASDLAEAAGLILAERTTGTGA